MALPLPSPADSSSCTFSHCFCRWLRRCSAEIPSVGSGGEFTYIPDDAVDSPAFSVLVGVVWKFDIDSSLRLHRFCVANSGRVLGRSGDALEILVDGVDYKPKNTWSRIRAATATRSPDGCSLSLCCFSRELYLSDLERIEAPLAVELHMELGAADGTRTTVSPLPCLKLGPFMPTFPISAAGELWAPYLTELRGPSRLVMQRLDKDAFCWVEVADLHLPHGRKGVDGPPNNNPVFQGYAVVGHIILLSLFPTNLFFTFNCSTLTWASVITNEKQPTSYVSIQKSAVYVEGDNTIYSLCASTGSVYAYKLCQVDQHQHRMEPPIMVDCVYPFHNEGNGILTHLGARVMCYVWIGEKLNCNCDTKHVLITTFRVLEDDCKNFEGFVPKGIEVLHSTCRRLDMWPSKPNSPNRFEFSILQVYEEFKHKTVTASPIKKSQRLSVPQEVLASSNVVESSKMLACCRKLFIGAPFSRSVMLERSAIQTNIALYIVCQVASRTAVFGINILDGKLTCHDKTLRLRDMHQYPHGSHFASFDNFMYAVSDKGNIYYLNFDTMQATDICRMPTRGVHLVCEVGGRMVALSNTLQYLYVMEDQRGFVQCCGTFGIRCDIEKEVNLSGYVVLSNNSFMVFDAESNQCFLIDLRQRGWRTVEPYALQDRTKQLPSWWPGRVFLSERSVFARGFIYTCSSGGLTAYELIEEGYSYYLGDGIDLQFSWHKSWEHERMCLDCIGENRSTGAIMFCVVQDDNCKPSLPHDYHPIRFTTVQVKTEALHNGKRKPKAIGHVDIARSYIVSPDLDPFLCDEPPIRTRRCFNSVTFSRALELL